MREFYRLLIVVSMLFAATVAHAQDRQCSPDDTLCVAEVAAARLSAANARIASLTQINADQKAIIEAKDQLIGIKDEIIKNLQKMDSNSQRIDVLGREKEDIWKQMHFDDKKMIGELQRDLASCRGNQKWIAGVSLIGGIYLGRKTVNTTFQNPFVTNSFMFQQSPEERMKQALKGMK